MKSAFSRWRLLVSQLRRSIGAGEETILRVPNESDAQKNMHKSHRYP